MASENPFEEFTIPDDVRKQIIDEKAKTAEGTVLLVQSVLHWLETSKPTQIGDTSRSQLVTVLEACHKHLSQRVALPTESG